MPIAFVYVAFEKFTLHGFCHDQAWFAKWPLQALVPFKKIENIEKDSTAHLAQLARPCPYPAWHFARLSSHTCSCSSWLERRKQQVITTFTKRDHETATSITAPYSPCLSCSFPWLLSSCRIISARLSQRYFCTELGSLWRASTALSLDLPESTRICLACNACPAYEHYLQTSCWIRPIPL